MPPLPTERCSTLLISNITELLLPLEKSLVHTNGDKFFPSYGPRNFNRLYGVQNKIKCFELQRHFTIWSYSIFQTSLTPKPNVYPWWWVWSLEQRHNSLPVEPDGLERKSKVEIARRKAGKKNARENQIQNFWSESNQRISAPISTFCHHHSKWGQWHSK